MSNAKDPHVILNRLVLDIGAEAKYDSMPTWRAQTHMAKVLLACSKLYLECETHEEIRAKYTAQVRPLITQLLSVITDEPEELLAEHAGRAGI